VNPLNLDPSVAQHVARTLREDEAVFFVPFIRNQRSLIPPELKSEATVTGLLPHGYVALQGNTSAMSSGRIGGEGDDGIGFAKSLSNSFWQSDEKPKK